MRKENPKRVAPGEHTGGRFQLGNWRVRSRLVALILIPTVVGVLLAAIQLTNAIGTSAEYRRLTQVAELVQRLSTLSHELGKERSLTAWLVADHRASAHLVKLRDQQKVVDAARAKVIDATAAIDAEHQPRVRQATDEIRRWLNGLPSLRSSVVGQSAPPRAAIRTYTSLIQVLRGLQGELGTVGDDDQLVGDSAAFGALHQAKEEVSRQQAILVVALVERRLDYDDLSDFLGSWDRQQAELDTFTAEAAATEAALYKKNVRGQSVDRADAMRQRALSQLREYRTIRDLDITTKRDLNVWHASTTVTVDAMRKVEMVLADKIVKRTEELSDTELRYAIISAAVILVLLLLVLLITAWVAGSLVRPLRTLRSEALEIAGFRLPDTVRTLRESGETATPKITSIGVGTRDEIGEVARAFDEVHREAVRLAGDEAKLRANVNAMFVNLSRRSQTLVERQLQLIEDLEHGEEDESRLGNLFRLDHLATRMRRNSENLLVLAGHESARRWSEPVALVDVARASLSEVENYERVSIQIPSDVEIVGPAVTDTVHLLAELIENAISFSPRETKVVVTTASAPGGVVVSVTDQGIGLTAEELTELNWRLANPPVVDVSVARRMGLFVVGRLALRHGVQVQLRSRQEGPGLIAMVLLPAVLIAPSNAPTQQIPAMAAAFQGEGPASLAGGPSRGAFAEAPSSDLFSSGTPFPRAEPGQPTGAPAGAGVMHTPWPDTLPPPGGGWPSVSGEEPELFTERPARLADEPANDDPWSALPPAEDAWSTRPGAPSARAAAPDTASRPGDLWTPRSADSWSTGSQGSDWSTGSQGSDWSTGSQGSDTTWSAGSQRGSDTAWPAFDQPNPSELTGPLPVFRDSPLEEQDEEFLPIFEQVQTSDWFTKPAVLAQPGPPEPAPQAFQTPEVSAPAAMPPGQGLPQRQPSPVTASGLPQRDPSGGGQPPYEGLPQRDPGRGALPQRDPASGGGLPQRDPSGGGGLPQRQPAGGGFPPGAPLSPGGPLTGGPSEQASSGQTQNGLPRRVPKANLVPGSVPTSGSLFGEPAEPVSPDRLRSRLSSYQQGVRQGREEIGEE